MTMTVMVMMMIIIIIIMTRRLMEMTPMTTTTMLMCLPTFNRQPEVGKAPSSYGGVVSPLLLQFTLNVLDF